MDQITPALGSEYPHATAGAKELGYDREAIAFLGLSRLRGVGFQTLGRLGGRPGISNLLDCGNLAGLAHRLEEEGATAGRDRNLYSNWEDFRQQLWAVGRLVAEPLIAGGIRFMFADDPHFPSRFASMPSSMRPQWLFVAGNFDLLERPSIAIVGTREPTNTGEFLARYAVSCAQELDAPVVSGLANGIDHVVHEWSLHVSLPTISVLGTGILVPYPSRHAPLSGAIIAAGGAVITEYLPDQGPSGQQFVWRNRLQAALGRATIAVEWKRKSGTAHTVSFSRKLGRPVFGLKLGGVTPNPEAGESDRHFMVPADHHSILDALRKPLLDEAPLHNTHQPDLFA
jgi:DNA processing protein